MITLSVPPNGLQESLYNTIPAVPGCHLLFAGPLACARHGLAAAQAYHRLGRVSYLYTRLVDETVGADEKQLLNAGRQLVRTRRPNCLALLLSCQSAVLSTDCDGLQARLETALHIPVRVMLINRLYLHAKGNTPTSKHSQQELIYSFLAPRPKSAAPCVNFIGPCRPPAPDNDLPASLARRGIQARFLSDCQDYQEFQRMADAWLNISLSPGADAAAQGMQARLGIPWLPLHGGFSPQALWAQYQAIFAQFGVQPDAEALKEQALAQTEQLCARLHGQSVSIDGVHMEHPCSLARVLLEGGVQVRQILCSRFTGAEPECRRWVGEHAPGTALDTLQPEASFRPAPPVPAPCSALRFGFTRLLWELAALHRQCQEAI